MKDKTAILKGYKAAGKVAKENRELFFYQKQKLGDIPADLPYSDENYYDFIGSTFIDMPSPNAANEYLTNVLNKLALIDFRAISGNRDNLFNKGLQPYVPAGDSVELQYTSIGFTSGYDKTKFVPNALVGGELVMSQRIEMSSVVGTANLDKRILEKVIPTAIIEQALLPAITTGAANG